MSKRQKFESGSIHPATALDEKGRCCGRKPIVYKTPSFHTFCDRCDRCHDREGQQIGSWAWELLGDGTAKRRSQL